VARFDVQALRALDDVGDVAGFARLLVLPGCVLAAGGVVAFVAVARSRPKLWADALGAGLALALTVSAFGIVPAVDEQKSARNLAELAAQRPERPSVLACVGVRPEGVRFYGGGPARAISIETALAQEGASFLALCSEKEFTRLAPNVRAEVREVGRARVGRTVVLVLVRAAP
jgi:hypothetical protein